MNLNTFGDIVSFTKQRCNISGVSDFDDIISTAINNAYTELKRKDPTIVSDTITSEDGIAELPANLGTLLSINPTLYADEYRKGKYLVLQRTDPVTFDIVYEAVPDLLATNDVPDINRKFWYALSTYGCYSYYQFKKKDQEAQSYLQSYYNQVDAAEPTDHIQYQIQNVYDIFLR